jgi:alpha-tubulin suppressor-like RCC1 family protein
VEATASIEQACARTMSGAVLCWGWSHHSQLGLAIPPGQTTATPVVLPGLTLSRLATGHHALCGIEVSRQAVCWGGAYAGPLGDATVQETQKPVPVDGASATTDVALSIQTACAALDDGSVICWLDHAEPYVIPGISDAVAVAVSGPPGSCALRKDRTVACWTATAVPVQGLSGVVQITGSVLSGNLAARTDDGRVVLLNAASQPAVTTEVDIHDAVDVSAGNAGVCAVHAADGSISCWDSSGLGIAFPLTL